MESGGESSTSLTLLAVLCDPHNGNQAWRTFCDRYQPLIQTWCRRWHLQPADVDDITQKVLTKLVTKINTYDPRLGKFRFWLQTVVRHAVQDLHRQQARHPGDRGTGASDLHQFLHDIEQPETIDHLSFELDQKIADDLDQVITGVKNRVEPRTWQAYWNTAIDNQPAVAVAGNLGMTVAAVYVAKNRVGKMLRHEAAQLKPPPAAAPEEPS